MAVTEHEMMNISSILRLIDRYEYNFIAVL